MPRLLLISLNRETVPYPVFPIGVWTLRQYLARHGVEADVADLYLLDDDARLESDFLARTAYDWVGISIRNVDDLAWPSAKSYLPEARSCVERVKKHVPSDRIVAGGSGYSIFGDSLLRHLGLRQGIVGDGEKALLRLILGKDPAGAMAPDFGFHEGVDAEALRRYYRESGMVGIQTRRGCPMACDYCTYPEIEGRAYRTRPVDSVAREIRTLKADHGIEVFYFVDCQFNMPQAFTANLLAALREAQLGIRWYAFVNPGGFDAAMADAMNEAGCAGIEFGSESASDVVLKGLGKTHTAHHLLDASRLCRERGLKFCHYLMLGAEGETEASVRETIEVMNRCDPTAVIASIGMRIYPGTPLAARLAGQGRFAAGDPLLAPVFYSPESIDLPGILDLCTRFCPSNWVYPGVKERRMTEKMNYLRSRGLKGPLWDYL